jgi:hypothetical protein
VRLSGMIYLEVGESELVAERLRERCEKVEK